MGTRLLSFMTFCLLGADHTDAGISQSPRHRVTERGQDAALKCDPISGHTYLYWYRQTLGQNLEFLTYFQDDLASDTSGMPNDRYSAKRPEGSSSTLKIQHAEQGDSALYLCASSSATVWHSHFLPLHKPHALPLRMAPRILNKGVACSSLIKGNKCFGILCSSDRRRSGNNLPHTGADDVG
uniref:Ig-like domain-containing protein n=1 Tax=Equus caballus TaxID=9796 RepID=A0A9L0RQ44_HORSE